MAIQSYEPYEATQLSGNRIFPHPETISGVALATLFYIRFLVTMRLPIRGRIVGDGCHAWICRCWAIHACMGHGCRSARINGGAQWNRLRDVDHRRLSRGLLNPGPSALKSSRHCLGRHRFPSPVPGKNSRGR